MKKRWACFCLITLVGSAVLGGLPSAQALTMKECSAKYKAAQQAGTLQGTKWSDFRKAECNSNTSASPASSALSGSSSPSDAPKAAPSAAGNAVFPRAVFTKILQRVSGQGANAHLP